MKEERKGKGEEGRATLREENSGIREDQMVRTSDIESNLNLTTKHSSKELRYNKQWTQPSTEYFLSLSSASVRTDKPVLLVFSLLNEDRLLEISSLSGLDI